MRAAPPDPLADRRPWLAVACAYGRALVTRGRLPPGDLVDLGTLERANRTLLVELAARHGPVFKGLMERRLVVCVVGHALGRRLLKDHASDLVPVTIALDALFPRGFMRQMEGEVHREYRRALVRGIHAVDLGAHVPVFERIAADALAAYAASPDRASPQAWSDVLGTITTGALVTYFFGPAPGSDAHGRLVAAYRRLGPHGVVWQVSPKQREAYAALAGGLRSLGTAAGGVLGALQRQADVDETLLGNLIYMVEIGRSDLRRLLRWLSSYAADHPAWLERIAAESGVAAPPATGTTACEAFVLETLRSDQSERLMRLAKREVKFDGWLIPKGAMVRVCMWEAHHDDGTFPQPFAFDPSRFLRGAFGGDQFAPFGLDHHHCPLNVASIRLGEAFLRTLARGYRVDAIGRGPAVRGPFHWEPSPKQAVALVAKVPA